MTAREVRPAASISCVIPAFNAERYLGEALESVFHQTLPPDEVIVVDDGSTDDTADVAARYGDRIVYLHQENAGPAAARNRGVEVATGELVAFQDADDLWHPEKLARQAARFEVHPELDVSITHFRNFWAPELRREEKALADHVLARPALPGYMCQTTLVSRRGLERVGPFNPALRFGEDREWFMRAWEAGVVLELLPDVLVRRRFHPGNLTRRVPTQSVRDGVVNLVHDSLRRRCERGRPHAD